MPKLHTIVFQSVAVLALLLFPMAVQAEGGAVVSTGEGGVNYVHDCGYEAFLNTSTWDYGVFKIIGGKAPAEGSTLDGDFAGLQKLVTWKNLSDHTDVEVQVIFNSTDVPGSLAKLRRLGCLQY